MNLPSSIPRFLNLPGLRADPLSFLRTAQAIADGLIVISEDGPIFSRAKHCLGAVAAFGPAAVRQVLSDADAFGRAVSVGERFSLPPRLKRLNAGLFSMRGDQHRSRQQLLMSLLGPDGVREHCETIVRGWNAFSEDLRPDHDIPLLREMRRLVLNISERLIFGNAGLALGRLIQSYFDRRRKISGTQGDVDPAARRELIRTGGRLERILRTRMAALREAPHAAHVERACLLARLAELGVGGGERLTDDELIAHGNV